MRNIAVILAGGVGSRLGYEKPKQFLVVAGRMVIEHTVEAFERHEAIDEIAIVMNPSHVEEMEEIVKRNGWKKVKHVLKGGAERYYSTLAAIEAYKDINEVNMLFHDAVRPCVSKEVIDRVIEALKEHEAVNVGVAATDTIMEVDTNGEYITGIPKRNMLRRVQTPQGFRFSVIKEAYRRGLQDPEMESTDDCGMVLKYMPEIPIYVVEGEERNVKLTYKEDIHYIERLISELCKR